MMSYNTKMSLSCLDEASAQRRRQFAVDLRVVEHSGVPVQTSAPWHVESAKGRTSESSLSPEGGRGRGLAATGTPWDNDVGGHEGRVPELLNVE